jgi:hypothetical protein
LLPIGNRSKITISRRSLNSKKLTNSKNAELPTDDIELIDEDADARLRVLEDKLEGRQQLHDEVLRQRDEDSRTATRMIEQMIEKNRQAEEAQVGELVCETIDGRH